MKYLEMLARLGVGDAHPGGFAATLRQLEENPLPRQARVLEAGCGTGRTACHLAKLGCRVTAVDVRSDMLAKAEERARREGVSVHFRRADVRAMPFAAGSFDAVLAESVTIFTDAPQALREYRRVLRPGGRLFDREIVARGPLDASVRRLLRELYGFDGMFRLEEWPAMLREAGFRHAAIRASGPLAAEAGGAADLALPDPVPLADPGALTNPEIWRTADKYHRLMREYGDRFGFALLTAEA